MASTTRRSLAAVALVVVATGGVAAHGQFAVFVLTEEDAAVGYEEPFKLDFLTSYKDEVPPAFRDQTVTVDVTVYFDGEPIETRQFEMEFNDRTSFLVNHTPTSPGTHEIAANATFSLGGGAWSTDSRSVRTIEVSPTGSEVALETCLAGAPDGPASLGTVECYLTHRGLGGLVPGLLASPAIAGLVVVLVGGALLGLLASVGSLPGLSGRI